MDGMKEEVAVFERTAVKLGNGICVKLPPAWTRAHNVVKGKRLSLAVEADGNLVIKPAGDE